MEGWAEHRKVVIRVCRERGDFSDESPPVDLHYPVNQIQAYRDAQVRLKLAIQDRSAEDGRSNRASIFLQAEILFASTSSGEVHEELRAELRAVRKTSDGPAVDRLGTCSPAAIDTPTNLQNDAELAEDLIGNIDQSVSVDPLSQKSINIARNWLETCVQAHGPACNSAGKHSGWMPTRLLEIVPGDSKIYLRESKFLSASNGALFVALSHCWGQAGTPFTSTRATLSLREEGIEIAELPKTFRDSVVLVASLGLQYIWIDSLCIIQDDADDWAREAAQMAEVYRNAHFVLIAANSDADAQGFLNPRQSPGLVRMPSADLNLELLPPREERWAYAPRLDNLAAEPVSARAWCLQERYLPMRALEYGTHQAFWECESLRAGEAGDAAPREGNYLKHLCQTANINNSVFSRSGGGNDDEANLEKVSWIDWYKMIEGYTARSITKSTDRLPALSGLVQAVIRGTPGDTEYLAGIWKAGFLEGLLWCKANPGDEMPPTTEYVAPSWSWAAAVGEVQFPIYSYSEKRAGWKAFPNFEPLAEYVSSEMGIKDSDRYGRLLEGSLTLRAPLLPVTKVRPRQDKVPQLNDIWGAPPYRSEVVDSVYQFRVGRWKKLWIEGGLDNPAAHRTAEPDQLFILMLARIPAVMDHGFVEHRFGLLLRRLDDGLFARVGFVDGSVLKETGIILKELEVVGYPRPYKDGDMWEVTDRNSLALDPLRLEKQEVKIC